jgi:hypothetical protein
VIRSIGELRAVGVSPPRPERSAPTLIVIVQERLFGGHPRFPCAARSPSTKKVTPNTCRTLPEGFVSGTLTQHASRENQRCRSISNRRFPKGKEIPRREINNSSAAFDELRLGEFSVHAEWTELGRNRNKHSAWRKRSA